MSDPRFRAVIFLALLFLSASLLVNPAMAEITLSSELEIRILLDNSASMYPGYGPPGIGSRSRADTGGKFYVEYSEMEDWLDDFVALQTILGGRSISFLSLTSSGAFEASDVRTLHRKSPLDQFRASKARRSLPGQGKHTYLTEGLRSATQGFEGILWLITDNIVEDRRGVPDQGVARFFRSLADSERFRSVHLYKLPFEDLVGGKPGNLAIYGILISSQEIQPNVLRYFDNKFRGDFLKAQRRISGTPLFGEGAYWKLKDLRVGALDLEIRPTLDVEIVQRERRLFREHQEIVLRFRGSVLNRLTQHRLTGGRFEVRPRGAFEPSVTDQGGFSIEQVPGSHFDSSESLLPRIAPRDKAEIQGQLISNRSISLKPKGFWAWLKSASRGIKVIFRGQAEARFTELVAEFDRRQMDGIFGADAAPEIFQIPARLEIRAEVSEPESISFELTSAHWRQLLFVLLLLFLLAMAVGFYWIFGRTKKFRVIVDGDERIVALRRLGSKSIDHEGHTLGRLRRDVWGSTGFFPNTHSVGVKVRAAGKAGCFDFTLRDKGSGRLELQEIGGGPVLLVNANQTGSRAYAGQGAGGGKSPGSRIGRPGSRGSGPSSPSEPSLSSSSGPSPSAGQAKDHTSSGSKKSVSRPPGGRREIRRPR